MRAKVQVMKVETPWDGAEVVRFMPVCGSAEFGPNGESEDNTFARYTPAGIIELTITNPDLFGKHQVGQEYYVDFTRANA